MAEERHRNWFKWLSKDAAISLGLDILMMNLSKKLGEKLPQKAAETIDAVHGMFKERFIAEQRALLLQDIQILETEDHVDMTNLFNRLEKAQENDTEERIIHLLCKICPQGDKARRPVLKWMNDMPDEKFAQALNILENDALRQVINRILKRIGPNVEKRMKAFEAFLNEHRVDLKKVAAEVKKQGQKIGSIANVTLANATVNTKRLAKRLEARARIIDKAVITTTRVAIGMLMGYLFVIMGCAFLPYSIKIVVVPLCTLLPLLVLVIAILLNHAIARAAAATGAVMLLASARALFRTLLLIAIPELVLGFYFSIIPVGNDLALLPLLILSGVALLLLLLMGREKVRYGFWLIPTFAILVITFIFLFGGRTQVATAGRNAIATTTADAQTAWAQIQPSPRVEQSVETAAITPPLPLDCPDAASRDKEGMGDYRSAHVAYLDTPSTRGCMGEAIYVPAAWNIWRMDIASGTNCATWIWMQGKAPLYYTGKSLPQTLDDHSPLRIASNCVIRITDIN